MALNKSTEYDFYNEPALFFIKHSKYFVDIFACLFAAIPIFMCVFLIVASCVTITISFGDGNSLARQY